jgi:hypothetical protein
VWCLSWLVIYGFGVEGMVGEGKYLSALWGSGAHCRRLLSVLSLSLSLSVCWAALCI